MNKIEAKDFVEKAKKLQTDFRELYNKSGFIAIDDNGIHITENSFHPLRIALGVKKKDYSITERDCDEYPHEITFHYDGFLFFALTKENPEV